MSLWTFARARINTGRRAVLPVVLIMTLGSSSVWSTPSDLLDPNSQIFKAKPQAPIQVDRKVQPLEELVESVDVPYTFPQPVPLQGIKISGLAQKSIQTLGENYFVVVANTKATKMSELYRQNRLDGKANYVTVDCIMHPYLAFTNRVYAEVIRRKLAPLTRTLLISLLQVAVADYNQTDDADVKSDIQANVAFLTVALKLIDPNFGVVAIGKVKEMVDADLKAINAGKKTHSVILEKEEDFSMYQPVGWYNSSPMLAGFFKARTWLSRLAYPINDVDFTGGSGKANNFRRSVLLYRCLDLAEVDAKPAYEAWVKLVKGMFLFGTQVESWQEKNLYPQDYKAVFKSNSLDLKATLNQLGEPLYRTKLLLAVRRQKPLTLAATSIWDIEDNASSGSAKAAFRLLPQIGNPQEPWLRSVATVYPSGTGPGTSLVPAALLDLNSWGAGPAGNIILYSAWALDTPIVVKSVTELKKWMVKRMPGGQSQPIESRVPMLVSPQLRIMQDGIQTVMRSEMWTNRRMESAYCAFLDSQFAIGPQIYNSVPAKPTPHPHHTAHAPSHSHAHHNGLPTAGAKAEPAKSIPVASLHKSDAVAKPATAATTAKADVAKAHATHAAGVAKPGDKPEVLKEAIGSVDEKPAAPGQPVRKKRAARGHYVDPSPESFNRLAADAAKLEKELTALGFCDETLKRGFGEFNRLFVRMEKIATDEIFGRPLAPGDLSLLANIDLVLEKIDVPLPAVLSFPGGQTPQGPTGGLNMALGRPGLLYIILQNKTHQEWTLARGAMYTYFEIGGEPITTQELLSRLDSAKLTTPYWTERFDMVQTDVPAKRQVAAN